MLMVGSCGPPDVDVNLDEVEGIRSRGFLLTGEVDSRWPWRSSDESFKTSTGGLLRMCGN